MTFSPEHLRIVAHSGNFTLWHYRTDDGAEELLKADYFASATGTIKKGDVLIIEKDDGQGGIDVSLYAITDEKPSPPSPASPASPLASPSTLPAPTPILDNSHEKNSPP